MQEISNFEKTYCQNHEIFLVFSKFEYSIDIFYTFRDTGALVAQWLALLTSDLEGLGSNPG
jgi:hypothetical protein